MKKGFLVSLFLLLFAAIAQAQTTLVCGPYLQNPTSDVDKMVVSYCLNAVATVTLEVDGHGSFTLTSGPVVSGTKAITNHAPSGGTWTIGSRAQFDLTGLTPGKSYSYRLKDQNGVVIDHGGTFRAFKTSGDVRFAVIGDFGTSGGHEREVSCEMAKRDLDFYVTLGDNVYHSNYQSIGSGTNEPWPLLDWWLNYGCFRDLHRNTVIYVIGGNHDSYKGLDWFFLGGSRGVIRNGDAGFVRTLTYGGSLGTSSTGIEYKNWIDSSLTSLANKLFKFTGAHYATHHCDQGYGYDANKRTNWVPIFEKHKVDIDFSGHHHNYQRFKHNDVNYVVDGRGAGAGAVGSTCTLPLLSVRNQGGGGFSLVTIVNQILTQQAIKVLRVTGGVSVSVVDSLTISKQVEPPPPPPNQAPDGQIVQPTGNVVIKAGQSVTFNGEGVDPDNNLPLTYTWQIGNQIISEEKTFTHKFDTSGAFTVQLTVRDQLELADPTPVTVLVTVEALPVEEFGSFLASTGFSNTQGPLWFYLEKPSGQLMQTYETANNRWKGTETYSFLWNNGGHPGNAVDAVRRFKVPGTGTAKITGDIARTGAGPGSVKGIIKHNDTVVFEQVVGQNQKFPVTVNLTVKVGDHIDFYINDNSTASTGGNSYDSTAWNPLVEVLPPPPPPPPPACNDGLDNDGDGKIDVNDPGCENSLDDDETDLPPPPPPVVPVSIPPQPRFALGNGTDGPANSFDLNKYKPRPAPYPRLDLPSFAGSGTGRSWSQYVIDPMTHANSSYAKGIPTVCHRRTGEIYGRWLYYQSGNTVELASTRANWDEFGGPRNFNSVSPYNTVVSDPDAGFWGIGLAGNVWILHESGRIAFVHGWETTVEDGKIYCGERKYQGTYDKQLKNPIDIALAYKDGKKHRLFVLDAAGKTIGNVGRFFIADTGNNRVAVLEVEEIMGKVTKSDLKHYATIPNPEALDVLPDNTIFVSSKTDHAIYKIDPHGNVTKLVNAPTIRWLRLTSRGDIAWANECRGVYVYEFTTNVSRFVDTFYSGCGNWIWGAVDTKGTIGPVDDALFLVSQTLPGTPVRISLYGTLFKSQAPNGGPLTNGRFNFPGYGNVQIDNAGHYPWAVAISDTKAIFLTTGFGDMGIRRWRRLRATGEPSTFNITKYQNGRSQWRWGYPAFGNTVPDGTQTWPSLATLHGWYGFSFTGLPNADDIVEWPLADQMAYIRGGADSLLPHRSMTDQQVKDALYYICMHSRKGILNGCNQYN